MQVGKSERVDIFVASLRSRGTTFGDKKYGHYRLKLTVQVNLEQKIKYSHFKAIIGDEDSPATGASSKGKEKGNVPKNYEGEIALGGVRNRSRY